MLLPDFANKDVRADANGKAFDNVFILPCWGGRHTMSGVDGEGAGVSSGLTFGGGVIVPGRGPAGSLGCADGDMLLLASLPVVGEFVVSIGGAGLMEFGIVGLEVSSEVVFEFIEVGLNVSSEDKVLGLEVILLAGEEIVGGFTALKRCKN